MLVKAWNSKLWEKHCRLCSNFWKWMIYMKAFCKKHILLFILMMCLLALASNFITAFCQQYGTNLTESYAIEAICKYMIAAFAFILMLRWGYVKKAKGKKVLLGILFGIPTILFVIGNLLPMTLVQAGQFKVYWSVVISIILAKTAVSMMEEFGVRGIMLPLLCEKWQGEQGYYMKGALVSSLVFGCMHFTWSIREIITSGSITLSHFLGNLNQVCYTFCFGMLAAGLTLYAGSLIPVTIWHSLVAISSVFYSGLMHSTTYSYYYRNNLLTLQNVFERYGILAGTEHGYMICSIAVDLLILTAGVVLVMWAERKERILAHSI